MTLSRKLDFVVGSKDKRYPPLLVLTVVGLCVLKSARIVSYLGKQIAAESCEASKSVWNTEEITKAGSCRD